MGLLIDATGGYPAAIVVLLAAGAVQAVAIWRIGDTGARPATQTSVSQFACSTGFSAMPWPVRGSASTAPVTELRRSSSPFCPDSVAGRDDLAVGQRDLRPGGHVEAGLDHAVVAQRDADPGVGADQAPPPDR